MKNTEIINIFDSIFEVNSPSFCLQNKSTNRFEAFYEKSQPNVNMTESYQIVCVYVCLFLMFRNTTDKCVKYLSMRII